MANSGQVRWLLAGLPRYLRLIGRLLRDSRVSRSDKLVLAAAVAYVLAPFDLIPDVIPILGRLDDLVFVALAIDRLVKRAGRDVVFEHWNGPTEALEALCGSVEDLARLLPAPVRRRLRSEVERR
jgi:uncharacterized membrane protein YkvA (DUF1232 family)